MSSAALLAHRPDIYIDHRNIVDGTDVDPPPPPPGPRRHFSHAYTLEDYSVQIYLRSGPPPHSPPRPPCGFPTMRELCRDGNKPVKVAKSWSQKKWKKQLINVEPKPGNADGFRCFHYGLHEVHVDWIDWVRQSWTITPNVCFWWKRWWKDVGGRLAAGGRNKEVVRSAAFILNWDFLNWEVSCALTPRWYATETLELPTYCLFFSLTFGVMPSWVTEMSRCLFLFCTVVFKVK